MTASPLGAEEAVSAYPTPCLLWEDPPIHQTASATHRGVPAEPTVLLVAELAWEGSHSPCQDAPQGAGNKAESCTHHHLAGYVPDIPILARLAVPWLPCTADAALL